ncbi:dihydrofolate reductase-like isoform X2 [Rhinatrema bivittatum]|uniref:dihydrofolate reductase-like isoform X2 n=1 Tax=Rhinatrema bivittatum TaxID=194408 RepID=UPI00112B1E3C|nr:dihydrofolate reductase-like isoform X2 [Rhinatrema bivittatum]
MKTGSIMCEAEERVDPKPIRLVAAVSRSMGIGHKGSLPWSLPNEFKYFIDKITSVAEPGKKNLIIWGRKSFEPFAESLLPLPNCIVALLSRTLSSVPEHVYYVCRSVRDAIKKASKPPLSEEIETIWVLGGVESFAETMKHPWCDQIHITAIMEDYECDTFFPEFDRDIFKLAKESRKCYNNANFQKKEKRQ